MNRIVKEIKVDAPIEEVWKAWTTQEGVESFFASSAKLTHQGFGKGPHWEKLREYFDRAWSYVMKALQDKYQNKRL